MREEFTKIEARLAKLEKDALPDVEAIRSELNALKLMSEEYENRSTQLLKAEEAQLTSLEAQLVTHSLWVYFRMKAGKSCYKLSCLKRKRPGSFPRRFFCGGRLFRFRSDFCCVRHAWLR